MDKTDTMIGHVIITTAHHTPRQSSPFSLVMNPDKQVAELSGWQSAACGATAGVVSRFVVAPLDVVKIRLQLQTDSRPAFTLLSSNGKANIRNSIRTGQRLQSNSIPPISTNKYRGVIQSARLIVQEEGFFALWKGNLAAEYLYLAYGAMQFFAYRQSHQVINELETMTNLKLPNASKSFLVGALAGATATMCTYPLDLLRTRYASQGVKRVYGGILSAFGQIVRTEGFHGLYRGLVPSLVQIVPYMGLMFGSYETLARIWPTGESEKISGWMGGVRDLACGGAAGIISKTGVFPLDVIRKRLQIQGPSRRHYAVNNVPRYIGSLSTTLRQIVRHEGIIGLYRGYVPGMLKAAPAAAITFLVYGQLRDWIVAQKHKES
ncbi:mitochondrial carrier domain-containing protein [Syncephalis fuscata]|nr:mitochondrial carrier domain-containing protein [Syncephalis fuscata]